MATHENTRKITISLPQELVVFADDHAKALNTSRSQIIGMALSVVKKSTEEQLAAEGYKFYAQEASDFAEATKVAVAEAWSDVLTEDKDDADGGQAR
jgi:hypothetical protein